MLREVGLTDHEMKRYMRQLVVRSFGVRGQECLKTSSVLVVGAGGLGCPVIGYLAAAGVGRLCIADHDRVGLSNLNRQILYTTEDDGEPKAYRAAAFARGLNPDVVVEPILARVSEANARALLQDCDVVIDGSDNISTRRAVASAALSAAKPLICGAVGQLEGLVAVLPPEGTRFPNGFEELFPSDRSDDEARCEAVGIIGAVAGVIGSIMALEAIKLLSKFAEPSWGKVVSFDATRMAFSESAVSARPPTRYLIGG